MSTILTLLPGKKKGTFLVRLSTGETLVLSAAGLAMFRLTTGQKLSQAKVRQIQAYTDQQVLYERAYRFISFRPRSEKEVRRRLAQKENVNMALLDQTIEKLKVEKLIDDEAFVRWWCEQRLRFRPRSPREVYAELLMKGISKKLARQVTQELLDEDTALTQLADKKLRHVTGTPREIQKIKQWLARKGFSWEAINRYFSQRPSA